MLRMQMVLLHVSGICHGPVRVRALQTWEEWQYYYTVPPCVWLGYSGVVHTFTLDLYVYASVYSECLQWRI